MQFPATLRDVARRQQSQRLAEAWIVAQAGHHFRQELAVEIIRRGDVESARFLLRLENYGLASAFMKALGAKAAEG